MTFSPSSTTVKDISLLPTAAQRKALKDKKKAKETAGPGWFDMPAPEMTPELEKDLKVLSMRGALDRKRHYRAEVVGKSKYFQMGTVVSSSAGFYSDRIPKRQQPKSLVDALLKDEDSKAYYRKKFNELQERYQRNGRAYKNGRKVDSTQDGFKNFKKSNAKINKYNNRK